MNPAKPHQVPRDVEADSMNLWSDESSNYGEEEEEEHRATVLKMHTLLSTWDATDKNKNCTSASIKSITITEISIPSVSMYV